MQRNVNLKNYKQITHYYLIIIGQPERGYSAGVSSFFFAHRQDWKMLLPLYCFHKKLYYSLYEIIKKVDNNKMNNEIFKG